VSHTILTRDDSKADHNLGLGDELTLRLVSTGSTINESVEEKARLEIVLIISELNYSNSRLSKALYHSNHQ
jgi:hypothetical protein